MKKHFGHIAVIASGLLWGTLGLFVRGLNELGLSAMQVVAVRYIVGFTVTALVALCVKRDAFKIRPRDLWMFIGTGVISIMSFNWCYFTCMQLCSLTVAVTLTYTAPAFATVLAALLFRERIGPKVIVGMLLAIAGSLIAMGIWSADLSSTPIGLVIGVCSGLLFALYSIFSRFAQKRYGTLTINLYTFLFAGIGAILISNPVDLFPKLLNPDIIPNALGLGIIATPLPFFLFTYGLSKVKVSVANILALGEIVMVTAISVFIYHESLESYELIGMLTVIAAVLLLSVHRPAHGVKKPS